MPRFILKGTPDPADNFYIEWSTVVDAPVDWGTAEELSLPADRKERADATGTSAMYDNAGQWDDEELFLRELGTTASAWFIKRENVAPFVRELDKARTAQEQDVLLEKYCVLIPEDGS